MQAKFEKFNELAEELKLETAQKLSYLDLVTFAQTSKYHRALFQPLMDVRKLLHHVTRGEHDVVQAILNQDINLIFKEGKVIDCSGREFENASPFEYTLWALDKHMWTAMIKCIPSNESGKKVIAQLIAKYNKVNAIGVTYRLQGKTITEKHFDFNNTIIKELQTQVDSINAPGEKNWDAIDNQWRKGVGGAQKQLPMHIVHEYCSNEPFYPVPKFTFRPKSSKQFYNWITKKVEKWFSVDSKLSVDFAIAKTIPLWGRVQPEVLVSGSRTAAPINLVAMTTLYKVRTNDFLHLKSQLKDQVTPENHHQVSRI